MKGLFTAACLTGAFLCTSAWADDFQDAQDAYDTGDYATALTGWQALADQGDTAALLKLAGMYDAGEGVAEDDAEALAWFRKAAMAGDVQAQVAIGNRYWQGSGIEKDNVLAYVWLDIAAQNGSMYAASRRDVIGGDLGASEMAQAQQLSQVCRATSYSTCP